MFKNERRFKAYLDYNASVLMPEEVIKAVQKSLKTHYGNGSSVHHQGRFLRGEVERVREVVAAYIGCSADTLFFTSGATESNNHVVQALDIDEIWIVPDAHESLWQPVIASGKKYREIKLTSAGLINMDSWHEACVQANEKTLIVMTWVNGETGVIQDVASLCAAMKGGGSWLHVDGTQALGSLDLCMREVEIDSLSFSAHKVGGLAGVGGLYVKNLADHRLSPLLYGGGQEQGLRSGSYPIHGLISLEAALLWQKKIHQQGEKERLRYFRNEWEMRLQEIDEEATFLGIDALRVAHVSAVIMGKKSAQNWLVETDMAGICISSGSACSSGKVGDSATLKAMGLDKNRREKVIRISLGWANTIEDINALLRVVETVHQRDKTKGKNQ